MKKIVAVIGILIATGLMAQTTIFSDDMTNFPTGWTTYSSSSTHKWTKVSSLYYSASYSAKCTGYVTYGNSVTNYFYRSVSLSSYSSATLTFYYWMDTEANYDFLYVDYYNGSSWVTVWSKSGRYRYWQQASVSIPTSATYIRFRFYSDASVTDTGVYVDNIVLTATSGGSTQPTIKEWTIMVYMNADNDLETYGIKDINEMEYGGGSNSYRNVIVQIDRHPGYDTSNGNWTTCRRYYITNDPSNSSTIVSTLIQDIGEVNMGDPNTLVAFAQWAIQNYPAKKYFLVLWDHGDGWYKSEGESPLFRGVSVDMSSGNAQINVYNGELGSALSSIKSYLGRNIDIIGFDACLMGMIEVMDVCRNYANYFVGSEETEAADGWYYTGFLSTMNSNPTIAPADLAKAVVTSATGLATLASVNLANIGTLVSYLNTFAQELINARNAGYSSAISTARSNSKAFYITDHIDLYMFANNIYNNTSLPSSLRNAAYNVMTGITNAVLNYKNSSSYSSCRGIAIYYPASPTRYNTNYNYLPISSSTKWDDFIKGATAVAPNFNDNNTVADGRVSALTVFEVISNVASGPVYFRYAINAPQRVSLKIYNSLGQLVKVAVSEYQQPGEYNVKIDSGLERGGVYYYQFVTDTETRSGKFVVTR
ncbi:MAG: clostripain-related cysteine peptidase [candidate division WOR-3 bacterium]